MVFFTCLWTIKERHVSGCSCRQMLLTHFQNWQSDNHGHFPQVCRGERLSRGWTSLSSSLFHSCHNYFLCVKPSATPWMTLRRDCQKVCALILLLLQLLLHLAPFYDGSFFAQPSSVAIWMRCKHFLPLAVVGRLSEILQKLTFIYYCCHLFWQLHCGIIMFNVFSSEETFSYLKKSRREVVRVDCEQNFDTCEQGSHPKSRMVR